MLLGLDAHHEGGNIDGLLADGDVSLVDLDAGLVHRAGKVALLDERLQSAGQELRRRQAEDVIELALVLLQ